VLYSVEDDEGALGRHALMKQSQRRLIIVFKTKCLPGRASNS
jgi:hypothetical protein